MAEKKPSILGEFSGRIGNIVIKKRNGKTYASKAASKYTISQLPHEIDKRNIQKVNGKFASVINQNPLLHAIWEKEKAPCATAYNKINKVNYHLCAPDHPTEKAKITPGGFKLEVDEINVKPDRIEITLRPHKTAERRNTNYIHNDPQSLEPPRQTNRPLRIPYAGRLHCRRHTTYLQTKQSRSSPGKKIL